MINFYKIPEASLPYVMAGGFHQGFYFVEREGHILNVAMTLLNFSEIVGDIKLKPFSDTQLPLRNNQDWDYFLSNMDEQMDELKECCENASRHLETVTQFTDEHLKERPTQSLGYIIANKDGAIDSASAVIMSMSAFKSVFFKAYPHMYEAC